MGKGKLTKAIYQNYEINNGIINKIGFDNENIPNLEKNLKKYKKDSWQLLDKSSKLMSAFHCLELGLTHHMALHLEIAPPTIYSGFNPLILIYVALHRATKENFRVKKRFM